MASFLKIRTTGKEGLCCPYYCLSDIFLVSLEFLIPEYFDICNMLFQSPALMQLAALEYTLKGWTGGTAGHVIENLIREKLPFTTTALDHVSIKPIPPLLVSLQSLKSPAEIEGTLCYATQDYGLDSFLLEKREDDNNIFLLHGFQIKSGM